MDVSSPAPPSAGMGATVDAPSTLTHWPELDRALDQISIEELRLVTLAPQHPHFRVREVRADAVEESTQIIPNVVARGDALETAVAIANRVDQLAMLSVDHGDTDSDSVEPAKQRHSSTLTPRWGCLHRGNS